MTLPTSHTPLEGHWWETVADLEAWYADYSTWARNRDSPIKLEAVRGAMWKVAACHKTVPASEIMRKFHLARGSRLRAIGYVVEIVSEHNRLVLGHPEIYLSSVVILKATLGSVPGGRPLDGYFVDHGPANPGAAEIQEMLADRQRTEDYCLTHPFD